jgi:hypothetical protein
VNVVSHKKVSCDHGYAALLHLGYQIIFEELDVHPSKRAVECITYEMKERKRTCLGIRKWRESSAISQQREIA